MALPHRPLFRRPRIVALLFWIASAVVLTIAVAAAAMMGALVQPGLTSATGGGETDSSNSNTRPQSSLDSEQLPHPNQQLSATTTAAILLSSALNQQPNEQQKKQQRTGGGMPGGYTTLEPPDVAQDERVQTAASFVLQRLRMCCLDTATTDNNDDTATAAEIEKGRPYTYSFVSEWRREQNQSQKQTVNWNGTVVQAARQVVAGMNYKLVLVLTTESTPPPSIDDAPVVVGAFSATVYDHFGDRTVAAWGPELPLAVALDLWASYNNNNNKSNQ